MKLANAKQMKQIDQETIEQYGIPGCILMEHAAMGLLEELTKDAGGNVAGISYLIFCGKGNNGGDGFSLARLLSLADANVRIALTCLPEEISGDPLVFFNIVRKLGVEIFDAGQPDLLQEKVKKSDVLIDAIFGTGFHGQPDLACQAVIKMINESGKPVIAVDIPSGLEASEQAYHKHAVHATKTVTFSLPKIVHYLYPAARACGEIVIKEIGIPGAVIDRQRISIETITEQMAKSALPDKGPETSKLDFGRIEIIAGSTGMTGAAYLCAQAALLTGGGLITVHTPETVQPVLANKLIECMSAPLPCSDGMLTKSGLGAIQKAAARADAVLFGPGLGRNDEMSQILKHLIQETQAPLVIDADGLYALAQDDTILKEKKGEVIITPHAGEMARLICQDADYVNNNTMLVAKTYSRTYNIAVVLKGPRTIVATPDGTIFVNITGNNGLSSGGTGDVLAGLITALLAQGAAPGLAAAAGVYLHAHAADLGAAKTGMRSFTATALLDTLPAAICDVLKTKEN